MTKIFSPAFLKKEYGLIPTVAICGGACVMSAAYMGYMLTCKTDISYKPSTYSTKTPWQNVQPNQCTKLVNTVKDKLPKPNMEFENLKREIAASYAS